MTTHTTTICDGAYAVSHRAGSLDVRLGQLRHNVTLPIALGRIDDVIELLVAIKLAVDTAERRKARCEE